MKKLALLVTLVAVALSGCSHGKKLKPEENRVSKEGLLSLSASKMRDSKKKFTLEFAISNDSDKPIIIMTEDLQCYKGDSEGTLKSKQLKDDRVMALSAKQLKTLDLTCTFDSKVSGSPRMVVKKVFSNPTGDRTVTGKVIGEEVEWRLPAK
jgi:hypothetical protein